MFTLIQVTIISCSTLTLGFALALGAWSFVEYGKLEKRATDRAKGALPDLRAS